ncbi:Coiled-coil domain-containing protein 61 [Phlyctochytrium planicorne]|nr:Coiled-coil domain-containing protein 61 [Phlyctochytrium planicorne]
MLGETSKLWLRGIEFNLTVSTTLNRELEPAQLSVKLRREDTGLEWTGTFTDQYVEEIARKTGNFKRFSIFTEMLFSAIRKSSNVVGLDILTTDDLENLKRGDRQPQNAGQIGFQSKKLYLILTYAVAFDRWNNRS